jgi:hypothetical protein
VLGCTSDDGQDRADGALAVAGEADQALEASGSA